MHKSFGEIGDQRLIVMAALTIADELSEARDRIAALEADADKTPTASGRASATPNSRRSP